MIKLVVRIMWLFNTGLKMILFEEMSLTHLTYPYVGLIDIDT